MFCDIQTIITEYEDCRSVTVQQPSPQINHITTSSSHVMSTMSPADSIAVVKAGIFTLWKPLHRRQSNREWKRSQNNIYNFNKYITINITQIDNI